MAREKHKLLLDMGLLYDKNPTDEGLARVLDIVEDAWNKEAASARKEQEEKALAEAKVADARKLYQNFLGFFESYYPEDYKDLVDNYPFETFFRDLEE